MILGYEIASVPGVALLFTLIAGGFLLLIWRLLSSPWGRVLKAMRDDELATRSLGKDVRLLKVQALALACAMAAMAGGMYASYVSFIDPSSGSLSESILFLSMIIVGGRRQQFPRTAGRHTPAVADPEGLRFLALPDTLAVDLRLFLYGVLLIVLMHIRPQGIAGDFKLD